MNACMYIYTYVTICMCAYIPICTTYFGHVHQRLVTLKKVFSKGYSETIRKHSLKLHSNHSKTFNKGYTETTRERSVDVPLQPSGNVTLMLHRNHQGTFRKGYTETTRNVLLKFSYNLLGTFPQGYPKTIRERY